jgi:Fe-S-cluster containining protein
MNRRVTEQGNKETNFCASGCATCCHQIFHVHPVEFEVISNRISNDAELRKRFEGQNILRQELLAEHSERLQDISKIVDYKEFSTQWIKLKIPCALLHEDKCLIYDIRPSACSTYLTLSPPRVCAFDPKRYVSKPMAMLIDEFGAALTKLYEKYELKSDVLYDLSWHLDQQLNSPEDVKKEKD